MNDYVIAPPPRASAPITRQQQSAGAPGVCVGQIFGARA